MVYRLSSMSQGNDKYFWTDENIMLKFRDIDNVPDVSEFKRIILEEIQQSSLSIHLGAIKMYQDLKKKFWWP